MRGISPAGSLESEMIFRRRCLNGEANGLLFHMPCEAESAPLYTSQAYIMAEAIV